jgi:hypothetical protein
MVPLPRSYVADWPLAQAHEAMSQMGENPKNGNILTAASLWSHRVNTLGVAISSHGFAIANNCFAIRLTRFPFSLRLLILINGW